MKGIVYLITSNNLIYVGSTERTLHERLADHKCFDLYDMNQQDYSVKVLEEIDFIDKSELRIREQYHMEQYECCNQLRAVGLPKKEADSNYYIMNRDKLIKKACEYQKTDKAKLQQKERYESTKDKIDEYNQQPENIARRNNRVKELRDRKITWGGDPRCNNNLLQIDKTLFH
tara:strand:+ start:491 stop:1009 length:519 start_codon:yes stop_codon:yes gene_type:complete